jgi:hypothetical protein
MGIYANMDVECLYVPSPGSDFVTEEIWNAADNSNTGGQKWVELGAELGVTTSTRGWFWANENLDAPPGSPYVHNIGGTVTLNSNYSLLIQWIGGYQWAVDIDGFNYGIAQNNPPYSEAVAGGSERTTETSRVAANFSGLGWYTSSGLGTSGWQGTAYINKGGGTVNVPGNPQTSFSNYYDGTGTCTTSAAATNSASQGATPLGTVPAPNPVPASVVTAAGSSSLLRVTETLASALGDPAPGNVSVVPTTRAAANSLMGAGQVNTAAGQPDTTGVYLVEATGRFTGTNVPVPPGEMASGGSYVWLTVDPYDNRILDWHLSPTPLTHAKLAALGSVTDL